MNMRKLCRSLGGSTGLKFAAHFSHKQAHDSYHIAGIGEIQIAAFEISDTVIFVIGGKLLNQSGDRIAPGPIAILDSLPQCSGQVVSKPYKMLPIAPAGEPETP